MTDDDCIPREKTAETVEALAESEHLAEQHEIGSDAEAAYVQAVSDAAEVVREWPGDNDDGPMNALDVVFGTLVANNGPRDPDEAPYPACLRPIAQAVVVALAEAGMLAAGVMLYEFKSPGGDSR